MKQQQQNLIKTEQQKEKKQQAQATGIDAEIHIFAHSGIHKIPKWEAIRYILRIYNTVVGGGIKTCNKPILA